MQAADSAGEGPSQLIVGHRSGRWHQYHTLGGNRYQIHFKDPLPIQVLCTILVFRSNQESSALYEVNHPNSVLRGWVFHFLSHRLAEHPSCKMARWNGASDRSHKSEGFRVEHFMVRIGSSRAALPNEYFSHLRLTHRLQGP